MLLLYLYVYTVVRYVILHYAAFCTYASILQSMRYICDIFVYMFVCIYVLYKLPCGMMSEMEVHVRPEQVLNI